MIKTEDFSGQRMIILPNNIIKHLSNNDISKYSYVTDIGYFPDAKDHFRKREQGSMQNILIYCVKGTGWISVRSERFRMTKDQYCFIPKHTPHTYASGTDNPWTIYWIHFSGEKADSFVSGDFILPTPMMDSEDYREERIKIFDEIFYSLESDYTENNLEYAGIVLMHLLATFKFEQQFAKIRNPQYEDATTMAITYMKRMIGQKIRLEEIAGHCGLSVSHFCMIFKENTSQTPIEYMNNLRVQKACQLLDLTTQRINEISAVLGFSDPFYFTRVFKKSIGQSPVQYRKHISG